MIVEGGDLWYYAGMKNIILFQIYKGEKYYVASGVDLAVVTQAETLDELAINIKEAVELHLEGENLSDLGFNSQPSVLLNFEMPALTYA